MALLEIQNISMNFGGLKAIKDLSFSIESGEIRGLIGPNGAGKTTLFNVISGVYRPSKGKLFFNNQDITLIKPHATAKLGLVRTFQSITLFKNFSVLKNVLIGRHLHSHYNFLGSLFNSSGTRRYEKENEDRALEILEFMNLLKYKDELALNLPHGHQRALGISIALAAEPTLLMLDEPVTGMNTEETAAMMGLINKINKNGITILIIEHDMKVVMGLCHKITVLNFGQKIAEGTPEEIRLNQEVHEAYLGGEEYAS
ncbi:MAG: ABC transporter ATP-binding protein [Spirochaetales bacterium]|nr:MAG: ABC transporter ATP-binding protein [Spirochaetales bacterium]